MEKGFFHPKVGYWQTVGKPPLDIMDTYPQGTFEVPLKPGQNYEWRNNSWVAILPVEPTKEEQESLRQSAYTSEADPLFFKWQAGEATEEEWLAKRQEIRDRYPYPAE